MTVVQQAFIDLCVAYSKFQIVDAISISLVSYDVDSYDALVADAELGKYGYCTLDMVPTGRAAPRTAQASGIRGRLQPRVQADQ